MIVLAGLHCDKPSKIYRIVVMGVYRERLLAAKLRIKMTASLHVSETGRTERSWSEGAGSF